MPIQSCIFIPAVPEGWHKSEQSSAQKPPLLQVAANFASAGGTWGEASLAGQVRQDLDTCTRCAGGVF